MSEQEYRHLKVQANAAGMGIDPFIRNLVSGVDLRPKPPETYAVLLQELNAIGNNINQIAYWANVKKGIVDAEISCAVILVRRAWQLVKDAL